MNPPGEGERVLLIVMPFLPLHRPALGVSTLKAQCADAGIECDIAYFTFDYAELIGVELYNRIDGKLPTQDLVGEWLFAREAFGDGVAADEQFSKLVLESGPPEFYDPALVKQLRELPALSGPYIRACADQVQLDRYDIVGFTSTFQQNCASLALARELKRRRPGVTTLFGGGNADGEMGGEWQRQLDFLDVAVSGEADLVFPRLIERLRRGESTADLPGVWAGDGATGRPPLPVHNLDEVAVPDFSDYFAAVDSFEQRDALVLELSIETSRGCWWGQRHHCTFCGLNGTSMGYRKKSPERAFDELRSLSETWGVRRFFAADNIVNPAYFLTVFPWLTEAGLQLDIQYEMKSSLRRQHLRALRASGSTWFQPGIESLSTHVLELMDKGSKAIENVQVLRWAREMDFRITWNCLCGFPGETAADYEGMLETFRHITHLTPPASFAVFRVDRFSPMYDQAEARGLRNTRPGRAYRLLYPFPSESLGRIAYFFECDRPLDPEALAAARRAWLFYAGTWWPNFGSGTLVARVADNFALVEDSRPGWKPRRELFSGVQRATLLAADSAASIDSILAIVRDRNPELPVEREEVEAAVEHLTELGWMLREDDLCLSLPLFHGCEDEELGPRQRSHPRRERKESRELLPTA